MVENYSISKRYSIGSLKNNVWLFNKNATRFSCNFDDGICSSLQTDESYEVICDNVAYNTSTVENGRYLFESVLEIRINEQVNVSNLNLLKEIIGGEWIVGVVSQMNDKYILNMEFAPVVTYQYSIGDNNSLTLTFRFNQNVPCLLFLGDFKADYKLNDKLCSYATNGLKSLKMAHYEDVSVVEFEGGFNIKSSPDSIKKIEFLKGSFSYVEEFDGEFFNKSIQFDIPFESHKYILHWNLIEFIHNKYVCVLDTNNENILIIGDGVPLIPSYTIQTSADNSPNTITIKLDCKTSTHLTIGTDNASFEDANKRHFKAVLGECIDGLFCYTLIGETNEYGAFNGDYWALDGYIFDGYNIVGNYSSPYDTSFGIRLFDDSVNCQSECIISGIPSYIVFNEVLEVKEFPFYSTCDYQLNYDENLCDIVVENGKMIITNLAEQDYEFQIMDGLGVIHKYLVVFNGNDQVVHLRYDITAQATTLEVPLTQNADKVSHINTDVDFSIGSSNKIILTIGENGYSPRTLTVEVTFEDGKQNIITIYQDKIYVKFYYDGTVQCILDDKYEMIKRLTGYTEDNITGDGGYIQGSLIEADSPDCIGDVEDGKVFEEICVDGVIYKVYRYGLNGNWIYSVTKTQETCEGGTSYKDWRLDNKVHICVGGTTYFGERLYISSDNVNWYATKETRASSIVGDKDVCDIINPNKQGMPQYKWVLTLGSYCIEEGMDINCTKVESSDETVCENGNKYKMNKEYISVYCNDNWEFIGYVLGEIIEENSSECDVN